MENRDIIIKQIIRITDKMYPDAEIYLFGSQARREASSFSDWDILILLNSSDVSFETETELMDEFYELEIETGELISPLIYSKKNWFDKHNITPFYENVQKEGIKLK
jgi:predicted nucleotidyltransferase